MAPEFNMAQHFEPPILGEKKSVALYVLIVLKSQKFQLWQELINTCLKNKKKDEQRNLRGIYAKKKREGSLTI